MKTLEASYMRCQRQILDICWWAHVSNAQVLQRSGWSTIGDILRHRLLSLFGHIAHLDARVPAHDALLLTVDIPTKAESQWPAGEDRRAALATCGSTRFRRMPTLYCYLRCGDLRSPGGTERRSGPLGQHDEDDDDDDDARNGPAHTGQPNSEGLHLVGSCRSCSLYLLHFVRHGSNIVSIMLRF